MCCFLSIVNIIILYSKYPISFFNYLFVFMLERDCSFTCVLFEILK